MILRFTLLKDNAHYTYHTHLQVQHKSIHSISAKTNVISIDHTNGDSPSFSYEGTLAFLFEALTK